MYFFVCALVRFCNPCCNGIGLTAALTILLAIGTKE